MGTLRKMRRKSGRAIHKTKGHRKRARLTKRRRSVARRSGPRKTRRGRARREGTRVQAGGDDVKNMVIQLKKALVNAATVLGEDEREAKQRYGLTTEKVTRLASALGKTPKTLTLTDVLCDSSLVAPPMNPVSMGQMPNDDDDASDGDDDASDDAVPPRPDASIPSRRRHK